ncbi:MAG TPA: redoxin domain-containing protein [Planctomycetota bacterium]|nr:redoxin domain-containing protein [Planctomycetota bacterium]
MRFAVLLLLAVCAACAETDERASAPVEPVRSAAGPDADTIDATTIVGKPAPAWDVDWMGEPALPVEALRGRVVLVRWFTEDCPYCAATAPTLAALHDELEPRGLSVIGMYHHKSDEPLEPARVRELAQRFDFRFPVAIDHDWRTLRDWWLDDHEGWTSVSFLIDRRGVLRYVHTGGSYAPGSEDAAQMRRWIDALLAEPG